MELGGKGGLNFAAILRLMRMIPFLLIGLLMVYFEINAGHLEKIDAARTDNFLSRTGILKRLGVVHVYGPACYQQHGCAEIVGRLSGAIDARRFNPAFPKLFPRLVQRAL